MRRTDGYESHGKSDKTRGIISIFNVEGLRKSTISFSTNVWSPHWVRLTHELQLRAFQYSYTYYVMTCSHCTSEPITQTAALSRGIQLKFRYNSGDWRVGIIQIYIANVSIASQNSVLKSQSYNGGGGGNNSKVQTNYEILSYLKPLYLLYREYCRETSFLLG